MSQRFKELDSLRGLAACTVVAHHFLLISPQTNLLVYGGYRGKYGLINALVYSPIHILWAGPQAVILFFVLSGFVLSLPFFSDKKICYFSFLIKRICRIYIPYTAAVTAAIVAAIYCSRHGIHELSGWFNLVWTAPISWQLVLDHYLFLGSFDNKQFDPVIWSLVQEMRISIIFPLLMIFVLKFDWKFILVSAIILYYIVGYQIDPLIAEKLHMQSSDLLHTPCFIGIFLVGALIAKRRSMIRQFYQSLPRLGRYLILATGIVLYTYKWIITGINNIYIDPINHDAIVCVGASIIVISALSSFRLSHFLQKKPFLFLGKISYSIYLFHAIVLFGCINLFYGKMPYLSILSIALISSFIVSIAAYYLFEEPSMKLGRYLASRRIQSVSGSSEKEHVIVV